MSAGTPQRAERMRALSSRRSARGGARAGGHRGLDPARGKRVDADAIGGEGNRQRFDRRRDDGRCSRHRPGRGARRRTRISNRSRASRRHWRAPDGSAVARRMAPVRLISSAVVKPSSVNSAARSVDAGAIDERGEARMVRGKGGNGGSSLRTLSCENVDSSCSSSSGDFVAGRAGGVDNGTGVAKAVAMPSLILEVPPTTRTGLPA